MVRRGRRRGLDIPASNDEDRENENVSDSQKTDVRKDKVRMMSATGDR